MKKLMTWALVATFAIAGAAFADGSRFVARSNATFAFGGPATTNNDDSCDISTAPAATLLLPYFEVDFNSAQTTARTTLFTITNVSPYPQIAHVVIWTDWSFPALDFNIFLTGYDVQSINLWDVLNRGIIAPSSTPGVGGTSSDANVPDNPGSNADPFENDENPNITDTSACSGSQLPGLIPTNLLTDLRLVLTTGRGTNTGIPCTSTVGGTHANAVGYITVDVAPSCNTSLPNDPTYAAANLLFDNVLIGDYQDVNPNPTTGNFAGGNPMVHIRAVPEGGPAGSALVPATNLPYTFYSRYETGAQIGIDRRQPLPSVFAARYIQGGTGAFNTNYKIWREGNTAGTCTTASGNANLGATEIIRFDEHENANVGGGSLVISPLPPAGGIPETGSYATTNPIFPAGPTSGDLAGWMYLNLNIPGLGGAPLSNVTAGRVPALPPRPANGAPASQNWVIVSMSAEGRYAVDFDAAWLGNGCSGTVLAGSPVGPVGSATLSTPPMAGTLVCPTGIVCPTYPTIGSNVTP